MKFVSGRAESFPVFDLPGAVESGIGTGGGGDGGDPNSNSNSRCFKRCETKTDKSRYQPKTIVWIAAEGDPGVFHYCGACFLF